MPTFESLRARRLLGAAVILALGALVLVATLRPDPFDDRRTYRVVFDSVQGLGAVDRNVRVAGVNKGTIGRVERRGDDALVVLEVDADVPIRADASAALRPHTIFEGSAFVDLHPGGPSAPRLADGATIPRSRSRVYVSLDQAVRVLRAPVRESLRDLVGTAARTLRPDAVAGLRRTLRAAPGLVRDLGPTARALRGPEGDELGDAIAGLAATVDAVSSRRRAVAPLLRRADATLAAVATDGTAPLDAALAQLPRASEQLVASGDRLTALVDRIDRFAVAARPTVRGLTPLLREARPLTRRVPGAVSPATPMIADLRVVLARAAAGAPELREIFAALEPGSRTLGESVVPYLNADSRLGVPRYLQLIAAFTAGAGVARPYQTQAQNPDGAGHFLRLGGYFDPEGNGGSLVRPSCATVAEIGEAVADELERTGLCQP